MKKFLRILLVLIGLSALGYWGYKKGKNTKSLLGKIHENADWVIKVGINDIKETLLLDALSAPGFYYDQLSFSSSDKEKDSLADSGIDFTPFNLVLYTVPSVKNTLFSTFEIGDSEDFEIFIARELASKNSDIEGAAEGNYRWAILKKQKTVLAWNKTKLVLAVSPEIVLRDMASVFTEILVEDKTIQDDSHSLIDKLSSIEDHIVWIADASQIRINFEDGEAVIDGTILTQDPERFLPEVTVASMTEPSFQVHFDANFEEATAKSDLKELLSGFSFFEKNNLNISEILDRTNGFFSLAIAGTTKQIDTIVSYEYDANFEKVAKKTTQEKKVPRIHLNMGAANESLRDYLQRQGAVENSMIFEPFPLYQLYVKDGNMYTSFDTFKGVGRFQERINSNFFDCWINFEQLEADFGVSQLKPYTSSLKDFRIRAAQKEGNKVLVEGSLKGHRSNINLLSQVLFMAKDSSKTD